MGNHYQEQLEKELDKTKSLDDMEVILERFKIVKTKKWPYSKICFDDKTITAKELVKIANQLASALNDRGCRFEEKS